MPAWNTLARQKHPAGNQAEGQDWGGVILNIKLGGTIQVFFKQTPGNMDLNSSR